MEDLSKLFEGDITLEGIDDAVFANLDIQQKGEGTVRVLGLYIRNRDGKEYRFYLDGDQPLGLLNALIQATDAKIEPKNPEQ